MADLTIYAVDPSQVDVRSGQPPVDQSALVAQLQAQVAQLEASKAALEMKVSYALSLVQAAVAALQ